MKTRKGFVTNSSSSSFICCFAKIGDKEKFNNFLQYVKKKDLYYNLYSKEYLTNKVSPWDLGADWAGVFVDLNNIKKDKDGTLYAYYEDSDHDDSFFLDDNDDGWGGDLNYDKLEYDDFSKYILETVEMFTEENGFADIQIGWGAGRNG